jgi:hypothetical protein
MLPDPAPDDVRLGRVMVSGVAKSYEKRAVSREGRDIR